MKKLYWLCILLLVVSFPLAERSQNGNVGDLKDNNIVRYQEGWSEWSLTDSYPLESVSAYIYLVPNWGGEQKTLSAPTVVSTTTSPTGVVTRINKQEKDCVDGSLNSKWTTCRTDPECIGWTTKATSCYSGCDCGTGDANNGCYMGGCDGWCIGSCYNLDHPLGTNCGSGESRCHFKATATDRTSGSTYTCCQIDKRTVYYYQTANSYKSQADKNNWKNSLADAGGYALKLKVYSYPQRVFIQYDGNGAEAICGTGTVAKWVAGSNSLANDNSYASNRSIKYDKGNPACSQALTKAGVMTRDSSVYISYFENDTIDPNYNLHTNEYYRAGYDFVGWSRTRITDTSNPTPTFKDGERISINGQKAGYSVISASPGELVTLYAVWKKHNYKIDFQYICGTIDSAQTTTATDNKTTFPYTYQIGSNLIIKDLKTDACSTSSAANNGPTGFLGWYEDVTYTKKLTSIPSSYTTDITLYAKQNQKRVFDYSSGKWKFFSE